MAKTIQEAGGQVDGGVLPTSSEVTQNATITAQKAQVGDSLAKDLLGITKPGAQLTTAGYTASIKSAERSAMDASTTYALKTDAILAAEAKINTPESKREAGVAIENAYLESGNKAFENSDAQNAFDKSYHSPMAKNASANITKLKIEAVKQDAGILREKNLTVGATLAKQGLLSKKKTDELVEQTTSNRYINKDKFEAEVLSLKVAEFATSSNNDAFTVEYEGMDDAGEMDVPKFNKNFERNFEGYVTIGEDGKRVYTTDNVLVNQAIEKQYQSSLNVAEKRAKEIEADYVTGAKELAKASMYKGDKYTDDASITHYYSPTYADFERRIKTAYPQLIKDKVRYEQVMDMYKTPDDSTGETVQLTERLYDMNKQGGSTVPREELFQNIDDRLAELTSLKSSVSKDSNKFKIQKAITHLEDMKTSYQTVDGLIRTANTTGDYTYIENYVENGTTTPDGLYISNSFVKTQVAQDINKVDNTIKSMDIPDKVTDPKGFKKQTDEVALIMEQTYKMANAGSIKSKYLVGIGKEFNSSYLESATNLAEAKKMLIAANIISNDANNAYEIVVSQDEIRELTSIVENKDMTPEARINMFNKVKLLHKNKRDAVINGSRKNTKELIEYYNAKGRDTRMDLSLMNWVMKNDTTVKDKAIITKDQGYDMITANTVVYNVFESNKEGIDLPQELGGTIKALFLSSHDRLVLPNRIGNKTNKNNSITNAVTGVLKSYDLDQNDVYIQVTSKGNVLFYRSDNNTFLTELNEKNIDTFEKNGKQ